MGRPVRLADLQKPSIARLARSGLGGLDQASLERFAALPRIAALGWPLEVVEQWLFDFLDRPALLADYGSVDLSAISWACEQAPSDVFLTMDSGPSEPGVIEHNARLHEHFVFYRPPEVAECWATFGTWLKPPIVIDRALLDPPESGLRVVEGRTRVGVLVGRLRAGMNVAQTHAVWVGRPTLQPTNS